MRFPFSRFAPLAASITVSACGPTPAPVTPLVVPPEAGAARDVGDRGTRGAYAADPFALPAGPRDDGLVTPPPPPLKLDAWAKARKVKGVAPPPADCPAPPPMTAGMDLASIASIADTWRIECVDGIVDPILAKQKDAIAQHGHVLVGLSIAGKLARTASTPPVMGAIKEKEKVKAFIAGPLKTWVVEQAGAIETLASGAAGLQGYGRGIAAVEAGVAELRLVDKIRSSPVPTTWDPELKAVYEASLDEALEPRKRRGRDAALVGMSDFAQAGIAKDERLTRVRTLLSRLYGGRRIDALDGLMVPEGAAFATTEPHEESSAYGRGISQSVRARFRGANEPLADASAYGRFRFEMGRVYWRRIDFVEAAYALSPSQTPEDRLVLALCLALVHGPNGAGQMMTAPSASALDLDHTEALDALTASNHPLAGMAAFDAAHLRSLSPPDGVAAASYLLDVAARFRKAESLLVAAAQKQRAAERAAEAEALARAASQR